MCVVRYAKALHAYYWLGDYTDSDLMVPGDSDGRVRHRIGPLMKWYHTGLSIRGCEFDSRMGRH